MAPAHLRGVKGVVVCGVCGEEISRGCTKPGRGTHTHPHKVQMQDKRDGVSLRPVGRQVDESDEKLVIHQQSQPFQHDMVLRGNVP